MPVRLCLPTDPGVAEAWAGLVATSAQASGFARLDTATAIGEALGLAVRVALVEDGDGRVEAGTLVYDRQRGPLRCAVVPALSFYHSPLLASPLRAGHVATRQTPLDALVSAMQAHYHAVGVHLHPTLADVRPFTWAGFDTTVRYTYRMAPGAAPAFRRDVRRTLSRTSARAAPLAPADAVALLQRRYARDGQRPLLPDDRLAALLARLDAAGCVRILGVETDAGSAAQVLLDGPHDTHAWLAGSTGDAMTPMLAHVVEEAAASGRTVDLGGANTPRIAAFKHGFGLPLVSYVRATWHRPGLARALARLRPLV